MFDSIITRLPFLGLGILNNNHFGNIFSLFDCVLTYNYLYVAMLKLRVGWTNFNILKQHLVSTLLWRIYFWTVANKGVHLKSIFLCAVNGLYPVSPVHNTSMG